MQSKNTLAVAAFVALATASATAHSQYGDDLATNRQVAEILVKSEMYPGIKSCLDEELAARGHPILLTPEQVEESFEVCDPLHIPESARTPENQAAYKKAS